MKIELANRTPVQRHAWARIIQLANTMLATTSRNELFDAYCEAEDLYNEYFPFEAGIDGDNWWLTRRFNNIDRALVFMGTRRKTKTACNCLE